MNAMQRDMTMVCREPQIKILQRIFASNRPEFLAIYGRRRVGKTFLIRSFFEKKKCVFFSVMGSKDGSYTDQLTHFTRRIGEVFLNHIIPPPARNWDEAFRLLLDSINKLPKQQTVVLFLDELPWLATKKSKLLQTLDYYWNQYWSMDSRIKLIVCGSSASWIIGKIINNRGGLHNRVTERIRLQPFNLLETEQYLQAKRVKLTRKQISSLYMVTGGIPFYLDRVNSGVSFVQIIEELAFTEQALLLGEFDNLFSSLFDNANAYVELVDVIAQHREGISQEMLFDQVTHTTKGESGLARLVALEDAGFIRAFVPHFHKKRGVYYRITDEYVLFYRAWLAPLKKTQMVNALEKGYWRTVVQTPKWHAWSGYAFETLCYQHLRQIRRALDLPPTAIPNTWRHSRTAVYSDVPGAQIDLLFDRDDDAITLCEIKYTDRPFVVTRDYAEKLRQKMVTFQRVTGTEKQLFLVLITANGLKANRYSDELIDQVVVLDDLFQ